ncbi:hypothetical protein GBA52_021675 [Prunus armeniaca]|nr:hypothetical protein GBA52_021675 [Prunus armeniaca]
MARFSKIGWTRSDLSGLGAGVGARYTCAGVGRGRFGVRLPINVLSTIYRIRIPVPLQLMKLLDFCYVWKTRHSRVI